MQRILDDHDPDGKLSYLVLLVDGVQLMQSKAAAEATPLLERAATGARVAGDDDVFVLAGLARGRCLILQGQTTEALAALDEIMVYVVADQVAPQVVGIAYCSVISLCMERFDVQRAGEWTNALTGWCDAQSGLVCPTAAPARSTGPRSSSCMVHGPRRPRKQPRSASDRRP